MQQHRVGLSSALELFLPVQSCFRVQFFMALLKSQDVYQAPLLVDPMAGRILAPKIVHV